MFLDNNSLLHFVIIMHCFIIILSLCKIVFIKDLKSIKLITDILYRTSLREFLAYESTRMRKRLTRPAFN